LISENSRRVIKKPLMKKKTVTPKPPMPLTLDGKSRCPNKTSKILSARSPSSDGTFRSSAGHLSSGRLRPLRENPFDSCNFIEFPGNLFVAFAAAQ
jgi:hypothetical protein